MKVFISWSGEASQRVAETLHTRLPSILQHIKPWSSFKDIGPGERWASNIAFELQHSDFAIVCMTPENLKSEWISFEVGSLSKSLGAARICPYLIGFSPSDLTGPLVQFQAVEATEEGTWRLVQSLNDLAETHPLDPARLREAFGAWWPEIGEVLESVLSSLPSRSRERETAEAEPTNRALLEEILRKLATAPARPTQPDTAGKPQFVFLVHGRAMDKAESIARYVEKLGPRVVILSEQPNKGRTVIEKFEDHSDVTFAIVLMTGDDEGRLRGSSRQELKPRARQNVVLELGYFLARLGRRLVVVLYEDGVELPSDYTGVLYIRLDDSGAWRHELARELKAAGLSVDLNAALT